jgi:hypothetical protein
LEVQSAFDMAGEWEKSSRLALTLEIGPGFYALDASGVAHPLLDVTLVYLRSAQSSNVPLSHAVYSNAAVATGSGFIGDVSFDIAITEQQGKEPRARAIVKRDGDALQLDFTIQESRELDSSKNR